MMTGSGKRRGPGIRIATGVAAFSAFALLGTSSASGGTPTACTATVLAQSTKLPAVPQQALDPYLRAHEIIDVLNKRPDQAAGSSEWDVVIKRLMEAQALAPEAPLILLDLGLANQLRGRSSAAAAWLKAAALTIERINPEFPDLPQYAKRIAWLMERPKNQVELALTFAQGEIPFIHAQTLPDSGVSESVWPPRSMPPVGPAKVQLPNGKDGWNPMYYYPDGTLKPRDLPESDLQEFLIKLRLGMGDEAAIAEADDHFMARYSSSESTDVSQVHVDAANVCLKALQEAWAWDEITHVADRASIWCAEHPTSWTSGWSERFRDMVRDAIRKSQAEGDALDRWLALAKELAASDDEIYFDVKIERLRQMAVKSEALLEGLAGAVRPIGHNLMRLRSIAD